MYSFLHIKRLSDQVATCSTGKIKTEMRNCGSVAEYWTIVLC